jgi:hypothetical protein
MPPKQTKAPAASPDGPAGPSSEATGFTAGFPRTAIPVAITKGGGYKADMEHARYHQPHWMNAIVIVWCSLVIAGWVLLPQKDGRIVGLVGFWTMLLFVAITNKIRAGAFLPRWDELKQRKVAEERSRVEQLFIAFLVLVAAPITTGLLAWALGNVLDPQSPRLAGPLGLAGLIGGLIFAVGYAARSLRSSLQ